jgi:Protein of unknown function, DUF600
MNKTAMDLQKTIVVAIAGALDAHWERIVVNYEIQDKDGGLTEDRRGFYIVSDGSGDVRKRPLKFHAIVKDLFRKLRAEIQQSEGQAWGTCDLVIDQPGRFRFDFSYDPPKRINGVLDDQSKGRFDRYLETYKAKRAGT